MAFVEMTDVHKRFGGVRALDGAELAADRGEVHGLLGPNGSGKSTLNKILTGVVAADQARIALDGSPVSITGPRDAARLGVASVYQQLTLVPHLTVEQNIVLGLEPTRGGLLSARRARALAAPALAKVAPVLGDGVTAQTKVGRLTPGQQQLVELAKALARTPRLLILDEATASLHRAQVELVLDIVRDLAAQGVCTLFVSHRLDEIYEICDRVTVLRSGRTVATTDPTTTPERDLVTLMVGDAQPADAVVPAAAPRPAGPAPSRTEPVLTVTGLSGPRLHGVDLEVRAGQVLGLGGLQGQGQSELLMTLFGALHPRSGEIRLRGERVKVTSPRHAARLGIALVPGDRDSQGTFSTRPIQENLSVVSLPGRALGRLGIIPRRERAAARSMLDALRIKIGRLADPISTLSGGNQQKVVIAKWLLAEPQVVLLDDPTKGIDVGAKAEIYALVRRLAADGVAVILNSSEDRELAELADRVAVMFEGRVTAVLEGPGLRVEDLVREAVQVAPHESAEEVIR